MKLAIDTYKRSEAVCYKSPSSRRFFFNKAKRLTNLARRIHEGRLFIPEIVTALREAADELLDLGNILLLTDRCYQLLQDLTWIKSKEFAPEDLSWDVHEKSRRHVNRLDRIHCNLCGAHLVWPATIVWRRGLTVVATSADIGINCLTRKAIREGWGKLQDLITKVRAVREQAEGSQNRSLPTPPTADTVPEMVAAPAVAPAPVPPPRPYGSPLPPRPRPVMTQMALL
jgi:hypothetical protein